MMKKTIVSRKIHSCEKCGCNIRIGATCYTERVYIPIKYDSWEDMKEGGYTERVYGHMYSAECDLAIRLVQEEFFKNKNDA